MRKAIYICAALFLLMWICYPGVDPLGWITVTIPFGSTIAAALFAIGAGSVLTTPIAIAVEMYERKINSK